MSGDRTRICLVINGLERAGAEHTVVDIARGLDAAEWEPHVVVVRDGALRRDLEAAGVPVHVVGGAFDWRWPGIVMRMAACFRELSPAIVHTHLIGSDVVGGLAARLAHVPIIVSTQHDSYSRGPVFGMFRAWSAARLAAVVAVSPDLLGYCAEDLHMPADRVRVIENGVDIERFVPARHAQRRPPVFGSVGSLIPVKAHAVLVDAFADVLAATPGARLLIAGDGPERSSLLELARERAIGDALTLVGRTDDVPAFLGEIDIFVHPSLQEALPIAVLEAMAAGKPVIASDLPSLRRLLCGEDGCAGRLVTPGDREALARSMQELCDSVLLSEELGMQVAALAEARYSFGRMVGEYAALYRTLLGR